MNFSYGLASAVQEDMYREKGSSDRVLDDFPDPSSILPGP